MVSLKGGMYLHRIEVLRRCAPRQGKWLRVLIRSC